MRPQARESLEIVSRIRWSVLDAVRALRKRQTEPPSLIVVGLGNPGPEYARTRHNMGFWCVDRVARDHAITLSRRHRSALVGEGVIEGHRVVLAKPRTFVNRSGRAITYLLARYRVSPQDMLVICDDLALPLGRIRLRPEGSAGGHNGIKSIVEAVGTQEFLRLRVGIGSPPAGSDRIEHVLGDMSDDEIEKADEAVERAAQAVASVLTDGMTVAMNRFN